MVKVHYDEGVANRIDPEPCGFVREGKPEASVGARIGQPSSCERSTLIPDADAVVRAEGETGEARFRERPPIRRGRRTWHVRKLSVFREPGDLVFGRAASSPLRSVSGR
jgi:hypothetical protein